MRLLCRYAGGLACLVTALALVACGGGPGSQPEPKQIEDSTLEVGKSLDIPLGDKFSGEDLTYDAKSNRPAVATVKVDNDKDTLTVTAVGPGKATITVIAKNSQGEANQTFTVTVPPPASEATAPTVKTGAPSTVSVVIGTPRTVDLSTVFDGATSYAATSSTPAVATESVSGGTLTITGSNVGPAIITVTGTNTAGSTEHPIAVAVTAPQPETTAPTVKTGAPSTVSVVIGTPWTVDLSTVFDGATSYTAESSATTIATESVSGGTLTITGVSSGPATITIVATNDAGTATHQIAVTVTVPVTTPPTTTTPTPSTLTIERNESSKRTLTAGQTLKSPDKAAVDVERDTTETGNVWIITALRKGTYTITIFNGDGTPAGNIEVVIPNSLPLRLHQTPDGAAPLPNPVVCDATNASPCGTPSPIGTDGRFETTGLNLTTYFEDPDPDDGTTADPLDYKVENNLPSWILMDAKNGFAELTDDDPGQLTFEVLEKQLSEDRKFTVTLYAVDDSGGTSQRPVVIELTAPDGGPAISNYTVRQAPNGDLNREGTLKVGPRMGVYHTLTFQRAAEDHVGFRFASLKVDSLVKLGDLYLDATANETAETITTGTGTGTFVAGDPIPKWVKANPDANPPIAGSDVNSDYYLLKSSGDVEVKWNDTPALNGDPKIDFRLTGTGRGTITIEYHVWKYTGSDDLTDTTKGNVADKAVESISLDIVTCNSPPDPLSHCPGAPSS